jgi:hypothetical protein
MPKTKTKKVAPKKTVKKKKVTKPYKLSVRVNDTEFETRAKSMEEALTKFVASDKFPRGIKTVTFLKYEKGREKGSQVWHVPQARRRFKLISLKPNSLALLASKLEAHLV